MTTNPSILIVDDEPTGREVLAALLHNQNYRLYFAANGPEALESAIRHLPDVILLDVMMTGMDGFEVCRRLRANRTLSEVPVVLITALDDRESRLQGIAAGADDFVTKPFDRSELRLRVQTITRLNRYRKLVEERSRLNWVVEHADDGYVMIDENDRIRYANPRAMIYLGLDEAQDASELSFRQLVGERYSCEPQLAWVGWPDNKLPSATPRYLVQPESYAAHALWLQVDVIDQNDAMVRLVRLRDVTRQLDFKQDTWSFHTGVLHKLRTPLSSMIVSMNLINQQLEGHANKMLHEMSEIAVRGCERLNDQISEILRYIQLNQPNLIGGRCPVGAISVLIAEVGDLLGIQHIDLSFASNMHDMIVVMSRQALELIFIELLSNAKKFHPQKQPKIEVYVATAKEHVTISVSDNGVSLSPEQLIQVWQPYYQAEKYFTGEVQGMGLGLTMVAMRMWGVGGSCRIANRENGPGVVVTLQIPCATL